MLLEFAQWYFINVMVALGLAVVAGYPTGNRKADGEQGSCWRDLLAATAMAVFCLLFPWVAGPGHRMDIRTVPLGLVGWRRGWLAS
ncbi:MAG TPA: hypothetical protein VD902_10890, partial [Symbiobacteriaceae bacterium]|nr:hypothetical protein [Symbiobacteriaceae bacterium]